MPNNSFENRLSAIDDDIIDATIAGNEKTLAALQQQRMNILKEWQENAGLL